MELEVLQSILKNVFNSALRDGCVLHYSVIYVLL